MTHVESVLTGFVHVNDINDLHLIKEIYLYPRKLLMRSYTLKPWTDFDETRVWEQTNEFIAPEFINLENFVQIKVVVNSIMKELWIANPKAAKIAMERNWYRRDGEAKEQSYVKVTSHFGDAN